MMFKRWFGRSGGGTEAWERVHRRLDELEVQLERLAARKEPQHITVERLDIHQPRLDNLTFRLDALDINELSGVLNLGNNFAGPSSEPPEHFPPAGPGPKPGVVRSGENSGDKEAAGPSRRESESREGVRVQATRRGFSVRTSD